MKNTQKNFSNFPRALRDDPFVDYSNKFSSGAKTKKGSALLGFLIFCVWNFIGLLGLFALIEWNLSVLRTLGVATLFALWQTVTYGVFYARSLRE